MDDESDGAKVKNIRKFLVIFVLFILSISTVFAKATLVVVNRGDSTVAIIDAIDWNEKNKKLFQIICFGLICFGLNSLKIASI
jgi:hypothetical protein